MGWHHQSTGETTVSITYMNIIRSPEARALEAWREAELQVHAQWDAFLVADRRSRRSAFAAYVAALDAEAAAADTLARTQGDLTAAA